jgi:hypothetical protein
MCMAGVQRAGDLERQQRREQAGSRAGDALRMRSRSAARDVVLERQLRVADVSIIRPGAASNRAVASLADGAAAAKRDAEKVGHYQRHGDANFNLVPFLGDTIGRLGKPAMDMLRQLGGMAARHSDGAFMLENFESGVLKEIGCNLCKYNHKIEQALAGYFALGTSGTFIPGLSQLDAELG